MGEKSSVCVCVLVFMGDCMSVVYDRSVSRVTKIECCVSVTGALYPHLLRRFLEKRLLILFFYY